MNYQHLDIFGPGSNDLILRNHFEFMDVNVSFAAEEIEYIGIFKLTNAILGSVTVSVILLIILLLLMRPKMIPSRIQVLFEMIFEFFLDLFTKIFGDEHMARKYFPILMTIFLFVIISNFLPYLPFVT